MIRPLCVHIGLPKTATTMLQRGLFANHSEIEFLGKRAGKRGDAKRHRCSSDAAFRLGNQLFWDHALSIDLEEARRVYHDEILPTIGFDRLPVFSFEGLGAETLARREAVARNLRDAFDSCQVIIGIRRPVEWVEAGYFHRLKRCHLGEHAKRFEFLRSPSPEAWLKSVVAGKEMAAHLDYARTIGIFVEALGRSNVGVFALEQLESDPLVFARSLCRFLVIGEEEGTRLLAGHRYNARLSQSVVDRMLGYERPGFASVVYAMARRKTRKRMVGFRRNSSNEADEAAEAARLSIPQSFVEAIGVMTRDSNQWIAKEWGLPLEDYGYPV